MNDTKKDWKWECKIHGEVDAKIDKRGKGRCPVCGIVMLGPPIDIPDSELRPVASKGSIYNCPEHGDLTSVVSKKGDNSNPLCPICKRYVRNVTKIKEEKVKNDKKIEGKHIGLDISKNPEGGGKIPLESDIQKEVLELGNDTVLPLPNISGSHPKNVHAVDPDDEIDDGLSEDYDLDIEELYETMEPHEFFSSILVEYDELKQRFIHRLVKKVERRGVLPHPTELMNMIIDEPSGLKDKYLAQEIAEDYDIELKKYLKAHERRGAGMQFGGIPMPDYRQPQFGVGRFDDGLESDIVGFGRNQNYPGASQQMKIDPTTLLIEQVEDHKAKRQQSWEEHEIRLEKMRRDMDARDEREIEPTVPVQLGTETFEIPQSKAVEFTLMKALGEINKSQKELVASLKAPDTDENQSKKSEEMDRLYGKIEKLEKSLVEKEHDKELEALRSRIYEIERKPLTGKTSIDLFGDIASDLDTSAKQVLGLLAQGANDSFNPQVERTPGERRDLAGQIKNGLKKNQSVITAEDEFINAARVTMGLEVNDTP